VAMSRASPFGLSKLAVGDARRVEGLRRPLMHLRPRRDEIQHDALRFRAVDGAEDCDAVRFQRGGGSGYTGVICRGLQTDA